MQDASAAFSAQSASESEYRQRRSSLIRMSRKQCHAEPREAQLHEGASDVVKIHVTHSVINMVL